ncbi:MAG: hypothetical protein GF384_01435, partial [Elusimicrobia bacterium]|nr:hypothetical protein [Elusimicrobiota bacterium]
MPGLFGLTNISNKIPHPKHIITKMQGLLSYYDFYEPGQLFDDSIVYAGYTHTNITQKNIQPYSSDNVHVWIDGEIINKEEICAAEHCTALHDAQLLHALYRKYPDFSNYTRIDGIFAVVLYDATKQKIHLISDRYGLRHLYWAVINQELIWGSEVKVFVEVPHFKPVIDPRAQNEFFSIGYVLEDKTWFTDVKLLNAGTIFTWDLRSARNTQSRYWWWDRIKPFQGKLCIKDIVHDLGHLFIDSVKKRCASKHRYGILLSGGLDSRSIVAAFPHAEQLVAQTFGKAGCDDIRIASQVSAIKKIPHIISHIGPHNWLTGRIHGIWMTDGQAHILHLHGIETSVERRKLMEINLRGFCGDIVFGG